MPDCNFSQVLVLFGKLADSLTRLLCLTPNVWDLRRCTDSLCLSNGISPQWSLLLFGLARRFEVHDMKTQGRRSILLEDTASACDLF